MNIAKRSLIELIRKVYEAASANKVDSVVSEIKNDILALQMLSSLGGNFIAWTRPAMRPGAIASVLNDIVINQRFSIVECGSGISTVYIARLLKQLGRGHLYSIEHDEKWIEVMKPLLQSEKEYVTLLHAPLDVSEKHKTGPWYTESIIRAKLGELEIDLLLVDGPPSTGTNSMIRYPALSVFKESFADNYAVILDDVNRKGENEILSKWKKEIPLQFHNISGAAIGLMPMAYKSFL
jgi:hypothetical protein